MDILRYTPFLSNTTFKEYQIKQSKKEILSKTIKKDTLVLSNNVDKSNDGKFSLSEASKNFVKGVISPVTFLFSSPKNFAIGLGLMAASAAAVVATAGAVTPVLLAAGVVMSALQIGVGVNKILKSKNGDSSEKAFLDIGAGSSGLGLSVLGAKSSLKQSLITFNDLEPFQANLIVKNINPVRAIVENIKLIPQSLVETKKVISNGEALTRLINWVSFKKPVVAVVDDFESKIMDIDGDLKPDVSHGETVSIIAKGSHKNAKVIHFETSAEINHPILGKQRVISLDKVAESFKKIAERINKGERIDSVNMSLGSDLNIEQFGKVIGKDLTRGNLLENKALIRSLLKNPEESFADPRIIKSFKTINSALEAIESVTQKGVKVYIAGGNSGKHILNPLNLADGTINVGSTNIVGNKMTYSADSKIINKFASGTRNVSEVIKKKMLEGYDISGNGKVDIPVNKVSGGDSFVSKFIGKKVKDLLLNEKDFKELINAIKMYRKIKTPGYKPPSGPSMTPIKPDPSLQEIMAVIQKSQNRMITGKKFIQLLEAMGKNLSPDEILNLRTGNKVVNCVGKPVYFDVDKKGLLAFNPDGSGRAAVHAIHGTSFSSPAALNIDLNKNFANFLTATQYTKSSLASTSNIINPFRLLNKNTKT